MRPVLLIISDSRGKHFRRDLREHPELFDSDRYSDIHIISQSGARINDLVEPALDYIENTVHSRRLLIVKIFAGINNLTRIFWNTRGEREITLSDQTPESVIVLLLRFRSQIKDRHEKSIVTFCTVPPVNLEVAQRVAIEKDRLRYPTFSNQQLRDKTSLLVGTVRNLNNRILVANRNKQLGITPQTPYTHSYVLKSIGNGRTRLIVSSLVDGVHGTTRVELNWLKTIWATATTESNLLG